MRGKEAGRGERGLDIVERAFHLLRQASVSTFALYYLGAAPFVLGLLFFLTDMSSNPFASARCVATSLGMALLYIWMRVWQSLFCQRLGEAFILGNPAPLTARRIMRLIYFHIVYSSWGLLIMPVAALTILPFAWVFAYFNNLCIVNVFEGTFGEAAVKARALATIWPRQNGFAVCILTLFALFVFLNIGMVIALTPNLLKSLLGMETVFSRSHYWLLSTTFWGVLSGLTYLAVDPLFKAFYVLRFHAGESIYTGEDLLADLRSIPPKRGIAGRARTGVVTVLLFMSVIAVATGQEGDVAVSEPVIEQAELDASVDRVMRRSEYTWRMPREFAAGEEKHGFFGTFIDSIVNWMERVIQGVGVFFGGVLKWILEHIHPPGMKKTNIGGRDFSFLKWVSKVLLCVMILVLVAYLVKILLSHRKPQSKTVEAMPVSVSIDIDDENVVATMLEEDEWIELARKLAAVGELRKSMRAWFLAGLAFLERTDLLSILHSKSNLEYSRELARRARRTPAVVPLFGENTKLFERAWYGLHAVTTDDIETLERNIERMRRDLEE